MNSNQDPINTFSFVFDDFNQCDERYYIKKVIDTGGINPYFMKGDQILPTDKIKDIFLYLDRPFLSPNMSMIWNFLEKMRNNNIRVLFGGDPGDVTVSYGQKYLTDLTTTLQWGKLIREINGMSKRYDMSKNKIVKQEIIFPLIPLFFKQFLRLFNNKQFSKILNPDFSNEINFWDYYVDLSIKPLDQANTSKKYHYYFIDTYSHQYINELRDAYTSAFSIEGRYPFFDKRLIEFCYALPTDMKVWHGWDRYILRKSMEGILPQEIQWRPMSTKVDFDPIYQRNLLREKNLLEEIILNPNSIMRDYVDLKYLKKIYEKYLLDGVSGSRYIWLVTTLYLWLTESKNTQRYFY